ncbi:uncharacterized protein LOC142231285 [Haematobia irritans]|uniref:uncharacterized protein LOC142231285 n=1 Tax=Haematobia irritans TaxID=7368 RepID=UPI003F50A487
MTLSLFRKAWLKSKREASRLINNCFMSEEKSEKHGQQLVNSEISEEYGFYSEDVEKEGVAENLEWEGYESDAIFDAKSPDLGLQEKLSWWAIKHNITISAVNELLGCRGDENSLLTRTPFKTVVDLKGFDSELRTNPDLVSELKEICLRFGGEDLPGFLRKSFKAIVSDELAMQFSWRGTKEKENMQNLKVISVLRDLSHHKFPNTDDGKITHILQQYIVHAKDRVERRQK